MAEITGPIIVDFDWEDLKALAAKMDARNTRDMFLLAKLLPTTDSPKLTAMIYDAVVAEFGGPGAGYDPSALFHAGQRHLSQLFPQYREALKAGAAAAREAGWG